jgi:hypothetical protein
MFHSGRLHPPITNPKPSILTHKKEKIKTNTVLQLIATNQVHPTQL